MAKKVKFPHFTDEDTEYRGFLESEVKPGLEFSVLCQPQGFLDVDKRELRHNGRKTSQVDGVRYRPGYN